MPEKIPDLGPAFFTAHLESRSRSGYEAKRIALTLGERIVHQPVQAGSDERGNRITSDLSSDLNNLVAAAVKGSATIYDKAMDANYLDPLLRPGLGGSYHRLFDGGHTIAGAVRAARGRIPR